jgi:hypothetical protein
MHVSDFLTVNSQLQDINIQKNPIKLVICTVSCSFSPGLQKTSSTDKHWGFNVFTEDSAHVAL